MKEFVDVPPDPLDALGLPLHPPIAPRKTARIRIAVNRDERLFLGQARRNAQAKTPLPSRLGNLRVPL
jgi:hypothetical protein